MMCDGRVFAPQIEWLKEEYRQECRYKYRYEVGDMYSSDDLSVMAKRILDQTAFSSFVVCGLSMGGILGMELLKQAPDRIEGMILIDTNHLADTKERQMMRDEQINRVKRGGLSMVMIEEMKPFYLCEGNSDRAKQLKTLFYDMAMDIGIEGFINQSYALRNRSSYEEVLKNYPKPTLIICGEEDALCPPQRHEMIQALIPSSRLEIIPACGHIANLEQPQKVNAIIKTWLDIV